MNDESRVRLRISGRVQGVGFRFSAVHEARRLGLRGWVRNTPDGVVETEAHGPREAVDAYVAWCRHGPSMALVTRVDVLASSAQAPPERFEVRH